MDPAYVAFVISVRTKEPYSRPKALAPSRDFLYVKAKAYAVGRQDEATSNL